MGKLFYLNNKVLSDTNSRTRATSLLSDIGSLPLNNLSNYWIIKLFLIYLVGYLLLSSSSLLAIIPTLLVFLWWELELLNRSLYQSVLKDATLTLSKVIEVLDPELAYHHLVTIEGVLDTCEDVINKVRKLS